MLSSRPGRLVKRACREDKTPEFARRWIRQHIEDAQASTGLLLRLGSAAQPGTTQLTNPCTRHVQAVDKPLLMEEFGVWGGNGDEQQQYYRLIYDAIAEVGKLSGVPHRPFPDPCVFEATSGSASLLALNCRTPRPVAPPRARCSGRGMRRARRRRRRRAARHPACLVCYAAAAAPPEHSPVAWNHAHRFCLCLCPQQH